MDNIEFAFSLDTLAKGSLESIDQGHRVYNFSGTWIVFMDMKINALAPWFGAKRNMARVIVELIGRHRIYWEPFCGSMAVLLAKPPCVMETVNDLHGDMINLARVIQRPDLGPQLFRRLRRTFMSEQLFQEAAIRYHSRGYGKTDNLDVDRAYDYFMCAWLGRNGVAGIQSYNQGFCVRYTAKGGHAARRLANVTILRRDAFELLERIDDNKDTAIYIDPPYIEKGAKYIHDFESEDHIRLAESLKRFKKARVIVSYYDHSILKTLYPQWTHHKINVTKSLVNQGMRSKKGGKVKVVEVLLVNQKNAGQRGLFPVRE